jgi:hypothetical protein
MQVTKETEKFTVIYSGVNGYARGQAGVKVWIYKFISHKIEYCNFWNNRNIGTRSKINRGYLTALGVYVPTECRADLNEEFNETMPKIQDKINKNGYIMLIGDVNSLV